MMTMILVTLFLIVSFVITSVIVRFVIIRPWKFRRTFQKQSINGPPFRPLLGQLPEISASAKKDDVFHHHRQCVAKYGRIYTTFFGPLPRLVVVSAPVAYELFCKQHSHYHKSTAGKTILGPLLGEGLFFSEGDFHKRMRNTLTAAFKLDNLKQMVSLMVQCTDTLFDKYERKIVTNGASDDGTTSELMNNGGGWELDVHKCMSGLTLDIIACAAFGTGFANDIEAKDAVCEAFTTVLDAIQDRNLGKVCGIPFPVGLLPIVKHLPTPQLQLIQRGVARIQNVVLKMVADRKSGRTHSMCDGADLLDMVLEAKLEGTNEGLSDTQIKDEAMTFVLAGHETTANLLTWTLAVLGQHPDVHSKLVEEVDRVLGNADDEITHEVLRKSELPYMHAVLEECLRVYPPVPYLRRVAIDDHKINTPDHGQLFIPKGTMVSVNVFLVQRDPTVWENPEQFDPQRWLAKPRIDKGKFLPFNIGSRSCIGQVFARLEAKAILCRLLRKFTIQLSPGQKIVPELNLTMRPKHGVRVYLKSRTK